MGHSERRGVCQFSRFSGICELFSPKFPGDVAQNAATVTFAVDETGTMFHLYKTVDNFGDIIAMRFSVLLYDSDNATAIVLFCQVIAEITEICSLHRFGQLN